MKKKLLSIAKLLYSGDELPMVAYSPGNATIVFLIMKIFDRSRDRSTFVRRLYRLIKPGSKKSRYLKEHKPREIAGHVTMLKYLKQK